jgi:hypothetical protein
MSPLAANDVRSQPPGAEVIWELAPWIVSFVKSFLFQIFPKMYLYTNQWCLLLGPKSYLLVQNFVQYCPGSFGYIFKVAEYQFTILTEIVKQ